MDIDEGDFVNYPRTQQKLPDLADELKTVRVLTATHPLN
jgi:hypothetical protein